MRSLNPFSHEQTLGVLLLDSDVLHLESWSALLSYVGYRVYCARNCFEAALHFSHSIQCVVLDQYLPDMSGIEFIRRFAVPGNPEFVVLTSEQNEFITLRALEAGAKAVVYKPSSLAHVVQAVEEACEKLPHVPPVHVNTMTA